MHAIAIIFPVNAGKSRTNCFLQMPRSHAKLKVSQKVISGIYMRCILMYDMQ